MHYPNIKYSLLFALLFFNMLLSTAQQPVSENYNVVTIIGDSIPANNFESQNTYQTKTSPNPQNKLLIGSENSLPLFENEFSLHTELQPNSIAVDASPSSSSNNYKEYGKIKKRKSSFAELKFNFKKRFRTWIPKPKKKYRPNICGRI